MDWKWSTYVVLGALILIGIAGSAGSDPGSKDSAFLAGYYTARVLMLVAAIWLIVKGVIKRYRGDDE